MYRHTIFVCIIIINKRLKRIVCNHCVKESSGNGQDTLLFFDHLFLVTDHSVQTEICLILTILEINDIVKHHQSSKLTIKDIVYLTPNVIDIIQLLCCIAYHVSFKQGTEIIDDTIHKFQQRCLSATISTYDSLYRDVLMKETLHHRNMACIIQDHIACLFIPFTPIIQEIPFAS